MLKVAQATSRSWYRRRMPTSWESATSRSGWARPGLPGLRAPYAEEPTNWSRRYKANLEKLASGDVIKVAEVVRDLWRREQDRGLSAGEKRMLAKARQILVTELALAENTNEDKAEVLLDAGPSRLLRSVQGRSCRAAPTRGGGHVRLRRDIIEA